MNSKHKIIKRALSSYTGHIMRPSKKEAPGISYERLTPKEKYYRKHNEERTERRLNESYKERAKAKAFIQHGYKSLASNK